MFRAWRVGGGGRAGGRLQAPPPPAGRHEDLPPLPQVPAPVHLLPHLGQAEAGPVNNPPVGNYLQIEAAPPLWQEMEFQPYIPDYWGRRARDEIRRLHNIATRLLNHLHQKYSNEATELLTSRSYHLRIDFRRLRRENRQLAHDICNNYYEPQMQEFIANAFRQFLLRQLDLNAAGYDNIDALRDGINRHARISFLRLPRSIQSFSEFLDKRSPVGPYTLFDGHNDSVDVLDIDPQAHWCLRKAVQNVLNTHRDGLCWHGEWGIEDMDIINDSHVVITIDPEACNGRADSQKDLNRIAEELLPRFGGAFRKIENGQGKQIYPAYMLHLVRELSPHVDPNNPEGPVRQNGEDLLDNAYYGWYYDFLMYHPALLPPKARKNFIYGIYDAIFKLQFKRKYPFTKVFDEDLGWTDFFQDPQHPILEAIYGYDPRPQDAAQPSAATAAYYQDYVQDMLKLLRHVIEHAYDHAMLQNNVQSMRTGNEGELFAAENFPEFFAELLRLILSRGCLQGEILFHWRIYVATFEAEV